MSWKEVTIMSQRIEFIKFALQQTTSFSELCRRFGISRKTGYKFLDRFMKDGLEGLYDRSKRPQNSPNATRPEVVERILNLRDKHPAWGGRKLKRRLENIGYTEIPAASTVTAILKRNSRISEEESQKHKAWERFEAEDPNDLWQMDFKGHFQIRDCRCHPLTIIDDHSRYSICIEACKDEKRDTVQHRLKDVFRKYGMPYSIFVDNGSPWGNNWDHPYTSFTTWLMRLGIKVIHSSPFHPQSRGKNERFNRTLKVEIINYCKDKTIKQCQKIFEQWRMIYNTERPHEALEMDVPSSFYQVSHRRFPEMLPAIEYDSQDEVRKVQQDGEISFKNKLYKIGKAFRGERVAVRPTKYDGVFAIYFCNNRVAKIDLIHEN